MKQAYNKLAKFGRVWFLSYVSGQTDKQTYVSQYLACTLPRAEAK